MPESDLDLLLRAGQLAAKIALKYFGKSPQTWDKSDGAGPVTEADLAIDTALQTLLREARPDYGWLSEETEDTTERLQKSAIFVVDPIDGTRSFINGHQDFSHSLAVVKDGVPTAAVVHLPARQEVFAAAKCAGATLNGTPISVSPCRALEGARVLAAKPQLAPELWPRGVPPVARHFRSSLAFRLSLVGQGRFDGMLTLRPAWEWDIAAGSLIASEAGAVVTDAQGAPLKFNSPAAKTPGVIAANADLHRQFMALERFQSNHIHIQQL